MPSAAEKLALPAPIDQFATRLLRLMRDASPDTAPVLFSGDTLARGRELVARYDGLFTELLMNKQATPEKVHAAACAVAEFMIPYFKTVDVEDTCPCGEKKRSDVQYCAECADMMGLIQRPKRVLV